ncbi:TIGR02808 family protein [Parendozoicomonas haliclonae]|uniref:TIGR02808 family protein n=1 Tax=Parendozoicomonas haliclonae TaxID=1960125 RepID=A0A1X7AEU3_9GAMM|nr:TIGR02808 family protein [Parendozoicomonas haliclonae]SMA35072.1 hypothetical protein EHSB41UT_00489 [Parendozoicomonas haliclonae]
MSEFIWLFLGYSATPAILLFGFLTTAAVGCFLVELIKGKQTH